MPTVGFETKIPRRRAATVRLRPLRQWERQQYYTLIVTQQRHIADSSSCQQLKLSISMFDPLLNKIRHPNNALNGRQSEKIGISCAAASPKLLQSRACIDQRTDCFVQYSSTPPKDRTAIHLGPSKITYGRHKLYSGDKPARSKVAIGDAWT